MNNKLSVIIPIKNRFDNFRRCVKSLEDCKNNEKIELIIIDYESYDGDVKLVCEQSILDTIFVSHKPPFRRSGGMNRGYENSTGNYFYFLDTDIIVQKTLVDDIFSNIKNGICSFPIFKDLHPRVDVWDLESQLKIHGKNAFAWSTSGETGWRTDSYGMCAFTKSDFEMIGKWNEKFIRWGGEDDDVYARAKAQLKIIRNQVDGLFHIWHDRSLEYRNRGYVEGE